MTSDRKGLTENDLDEMRRAVAHRHTPGFRVDNGDVIERLLAEIDRLRTWDGLMSLLDEKWPEDIFPTREDDSERDPGPRIVSLLRWVDRLQTQLRNSEQCAVRELQAQVRADDFEDEAARLRAENTALAAAVDQFRSFPDNPGPGNWSTSYRMGYADAGRDVRAITHALGLVQDREGQADA